MSASRWTPPALTGSFRLESQMFSNRWRLRHRESILAVLQRDPTRHTSTVVLDDGVRLTLTPAGWGTVVVTRDGIELARVDRRSWWGRRWEISGSGFGCELTSDPMPRRWTFRIGGEPIGRLSGSIWSYNRLTVQADVSIPLHAIALAWHVLARPWEAAAAPRSLVPERAATQ